MGVVSGILLSVPQVVNSVYNWFMHSNLRPSYVECHAHVLIEGSSKFDVFNIS
jgi:hypothetical protein